MNTNELRRGNILHHTPFPHHKEIVRVMAILLEEIAHSEGSKGLILNDVNEYEPIPLTEDILLKCGFVKPAHSWNGDIFHLSEWDDYPLNWMVAMDKNGAVIVKKLKYLHQLQNLYFALTQQELEVNL